ncbi:hypothetical protein QWZ13_12485 [Reinekea marina]|uniref:hypothetical protein n=1 Tax=Reinekea marina TaxID=1310421 RepID=UPI0025B3B77C|nr:hypothetical protein [Reinekea marina]MDN3649729.1 hypothetical protein [Reinekea marina]
MTRKSGKAVHQIHQIAWAVRSLNSDSYASRERVVRFEAYCTVTCYFVGTFNKRYRSVRMSGISSNICFNSDFC